MKNDLGLARTVEELHKRYNCTECFDTKKVRVKVEAGNQWVDCPHCSLKHLPHDEAPAGTGIRAATS